MSSVARLISSVQLPNSDGGSVVTVDEGRNVLSDLARDQRVTPAAATGLWTLAQQPASTFAPYDLSTPRLGDRRSLLMQAYSVGLLKNIPFRVLSGVPGLKLAMQPSLVLRNPGISTFSGPNDLLAGLRAYRAFTLTTRDNTALRDGRLAFNWGFDTYAVQTAKGMPVAEVVGSLQVQMAESARRTGAMAPLLETETGGGVTRYTLLAGYFPGDQRQALAWQERVNGMLPRADQR